MKLTRTTPETIDLASEIQHAKDAAPSSARLVAAKKKLEDLIGQANNDGAEIERLKRELAARASGNLLERATAYLSGKLLDTQNIEEAIVQRSARLELLKEAIKLQHDSARKLESAVYGEVNAALKELRQPLVTRVDVALAELQAVAEEDATLRVAIAQSGVKAPMGGGGADFVTQHPALRGLASYQNWRACMSAFGYALIERTIAPAAESAVRLPM